MKVRLLSPLIIALLYLATPGTGLSQEPTLKIDFSNLAESPKVNPRIGFLGGLRDETSDAQVQDLHPALFRIGHQFRGRIKEGLNKAIERVEGFGAKYKLVMSDLIDSQPKDWDKYEADVKKLVLSTGAHAKTILWEPVNEPDVSYKPIDKYYELYGHAFKALREAEKEAQICGPSFAFPDYKKYKAFLDYCHEHQLECNALCWHYTGWDPNIPEQSKWNLGKLREFITEFKDQKIQEIHCDEWGAGSDKPGHLHPGRMILWFYYLENVYKVDRACRANWGKADDYLGGTINPQGETYPVYFAFRWYGATKDQTRIVTEGNSKSVACLASKDNDHREILLGSILKGSTGVVLELKNVGLDKFKTTVQQLPNTNLESPITESGIAAYKDCKVEQINDLVRITLDKVEENEAFRVVLSK